MIPETIIDGFYRELSGTIGVFQGIRFFIAPTIDEVCSYALEYDVFRHNHSSDVVTKALPKLDFHGFGGGVFGLVRRQESLDDAVSEEEYKSKLLKLEEAIATESKRLQDMKEQSREELNKLRGSVWNRLFRSDNIRLREERLRQDQFNQKIQIAENEHSRDFHIYKKRAADQFRARFGKEPAEALIHYGNNLNRGMPGETRNPSCFFYLVGTKTVATEFMNIALNHHRDIPDIVKGLVARTPYAARAHTYQENRVHYDIKDPDDKFLRPKDLERNKADAKFYEFPFRFFGIGDFTARTTKIYPD